MRTLLITDLHFTEKPIGLMDAQKKCVKRIFDEETPEEVIIMGDLMMHRKPSPSVLLALSEVLQHFAETAKVYILRGNHDSETKADDGVTALTLFSPYAKVITQTWFDHKTKRVFIPHYEDEDTIKEALATAPKGYTVFGHFGYAGCLNSAGDADFHISLSNFRNDCFLGHIHKCRQETVRSKGLQHTVTILGTPYTTNFGETKKLNYYAILEDGKAEYKVLQHGPRHIMVDRGMLDPLIEELNDPDYFTMLRVLLDSSETEPPYDLLDVAYVDIKYKPVFDEDNLSNYQPSRDLFSLNDVIIEDYVSSAETTLEKEQIMEGYMLLKNED